MKNLSVRIEVAVGMLSILVAILACNEPERKIDPTILAPVDLSRQDLSEKNMPWFDFSYKIMQGVNMKGSEISGANFMFADLRDADLSNAIAYNANFQSADLRGAKLDRLCFLGAIWTDAKLDAHWSEVVTLVGNGPKVTRDLQGADLSGVCLAGYELREQNLDGANLSETLLAGTNFAGASLRQTDLTNAHLGQASFLDADLNGAIVTEAQLEIALLCRTILPDGQVSNRNCNLVRPTPTP